MFRNKRAAVLFFVAALLMFLFPLSSAYAESNGVIPLSEPLNPIKSKRTVLTVDNGEQKIKFTITDLERLGLYRLSTRTFWKDDDGIYEGVLLKAVLEKTGLSEVDAIHVDALDGYSSVIQRADWETWPVMLATRRDGKAMSVRNKGPTRIIYPFDTDPVLQETSRRTAWVWAVKSIQRSVK